MNEKNMIIDFRVRLPPTNFAEVANVNELPDFMAHYDEMYGLLEKMKVNEEGLIKLMDKSDVFLSVLQAEYEFGDYHKFNDSVAQIVQKYPKRFVGYCSVDPRDGMNAVREINRCVKDLNMKGLNLQPWVQDLLPTHRKFYPLYAKCVELNIPVTIHMGINFALNRSMRVGRPITIDEIAQDFPELKIVINHGGWPWVNESVAVAWRNPNVYIEFGAVAPKYIGKRGTGWETLLTYGNSLLQDRILFATDWPVMQFHRAIKEFNELPFKEEVKEKILFKNAESLLDLK